MGDHSGSWTVRSTADDAYPFRNQPALLRFAVAIGTVAVVFLLDSLFSNLIDDGSHYLLLGTAVMATAWVAGTGPALAATVTGAILGATIQRNPLADGRATETHLALFVVQGLLLTALVSELRRVRFEAEERAREAHDARRESEAASRMKDEFLATISHELRTPLNSVLGWLHLLRTGKLDVQTSDRGLEAIERNVRLQAQLTADLLDVSKVLTGTLRLDCRPVSFADVVKQAVLAALPAAQAKGVQVTSSIPDSSVPVLGDAARLRQIAWHLLANAIKFTPRGGAVRLLLEPAADQVTLTVTDSGPGIDPAFLPRIFDRFTQEDPSPTRTAGGLGVGLSLIRDLVELHGGEILGSNREGERGAVFTVRIPTQAVAPARLPQIAADYARVTAPPLEGVRVLVLDSDADGRELLRTVLQQRGALVRTADSVGEALEALEGWRPDVLITDSGSPDHDTYALVGKVPGLEPERGGRIPAAALTSAARTDEHVRQMLEPAQRDLPKPVEPAVLAAEIASLTGRERRRVQRG